MTIRLLRSGTIQDLQMRFGDLIGRLCLYAVDTVYAINSKSVNL